MYKPADYLLLLLLAAIWGASYLFIRLIVPTLGPWGLVCARMLIAAGALILAARVLRLPWGQWRLVGHYFALAFAAAFASQVMIAWSAYELNAAMLAILNATSVMFSALLSVLVMRERLRRSSAIGLLLGVAGVAMVVGFTPQAFTWPVVLATLASLGAAFGYAVANVYAATRLAGRSALELSIVQNLCAGLMAAPLGLPAIVGAWPPPLLVTGSLLTLALVSTAAANWLYYILMRRTSPTFALSVTYLIPCFGLLWGALFMDEGITLLQCGGFMVVLVSLYLLGARR